MAFYHDLDALINPRTAPLLDSLYQVFFSPEELARSHDRSRSIKLLVAKLSKVIPENVMLSLLLRTLREKIMYLKQAGNLLRHCTIADLRRQIVPHTMKQILVDFGFTLDLLIENGYALQPSYEIVREIQIRFNEICRQHKADPCDVRTQGGEIFTLRSLTNDAPLSVAPDFIPSDFVPLDVVSSDLILSNSTSSTEQSDQESTPMVAGETPIPQGETMTYYKLNGFCPLLRKKMIIFCRGAYAHRQCTIIRFNSKNTQCFFPDDQTIHHISCDVPLLWEDKIDSE